MEIDNIAENSEDFTGNVWRISNGETVLIDAGTGDSWNAIKTLEKVDKVVVTHSHYDHVDNLPKIVEKFDPDVFAFEPDNLEVESRELSEEDTVELYGTDFKVFHTPGHKNDSICLFGEGILFAGDLLFPEGGFGRTDLEEGDRDTLIESIEKIAELDVKEMYCGHKEAAKENVNGQIESSLEDARKKESKY
jgi:glyoxylase-like metal-dependent hydrolase (beta-lactamase superfamily II)